MTFMKTIIAFLLSITLLSACSNQEDKNKFTVTGEIKNAPDQQVYLEELFFSQKNPQVIDTADLKGGKFVLSGIAEQQGLYRIRLKEGNKGFIFINDKPAITFIADLTDMGIKNTGFSSPANTTMKNYIVTLDSIGAKYMAASNRLKELSAVKGGSDSLIAVCNSDMQAASASHKAYILKFIDTTTNPVMALLALSNTRGFDPADIEKQVMGLSKRFPKHDAIATIVTQFAEVRNQQKTKVQTSKIQPGTMAPDFTMPDTEDKPFSLSSLKGKYVLVDFWASWCGPCRQENPNLVRTYQKFKSRNFEILGVSLDNNKDKWLQAIKEDQLNWPHVSDLKYWKNEVALQYGVQSIPANFLLDKEGKIIAKGLRGQALEQALEKLLK